MKYYFAVLRKYAVFNGRSRRKEFWYFILFNFIAILIVDIIGIILKLPIDRRDYRISVDIYNVIIVLPLIGLWIRRMHDVNKSGWYALIPIYNLLLALEAGSHGSNEYGPDPKGEYY